MLVHVVCKVQVVFMDLVDNVDFVDFVDFSPWHPGAGGGSHIAARLGSQESKDAPATINS